MGIFQTKSFEDLRASLLNYIYYSDNALTDFNVGSVMRALIEAVAMEEEEVYFRLWQAIQAAIKESILYAFGFTPKEGTVATGTVEFGRETAAPADYVIPEGTEVISATGIVYKTTAEATLLSGTTSVTAPVSSQSVGSDANITTIGTSLQIVNAIYGISWCKTYTQIIGGSDTETKEALRQRFSDFINSLSRSTIKAVEYGASTVKLTDAEGNVTEEVKKIKILDYVTDPDIPKGELLIYIDNGTGAPSGQNKIKNWGFESAIDFEHWTAQSATIATDVNHFGKKSSRLEATGAAVNGAKSDAYTVDTTKKYHFTAWNKITSFTTGNYKNKIHFYSDAAGTVLISSEDLVDITEQTDYWTRTRKTIGVAGDILFPANTASIRIEQVWEGAATGVGYLDEVFFFEDATLISETVKVLEGYEEGGTKYEGYKAAGVECNVISVTPVKTDITVTVKSDLFQTIKSYVETAITDYFDAIDIGEDINYEKLIAIIFNCHEEVLDVHTLKIRVDTNGDGVPETDYTTDVSINKSERAILGKITVNEG